MNSNPEQDIDVMQIDFDEPGVVVDPRETVPQVKEFRSGRIGEEPKEEVRQENDIARDTAAEPKNEAMQQIEIDTKMVMVEKARKANSMTVFIDPIGFEQMRQVAKTFVEEGALSSDVKNASQMLMKLMTGAEMGMTPAETLNSLYMVNGRINVFGQAIIGRIKRAGWNVQYMEGGELNHEWCKAFVYRGGKINYDDDYTFSGFDKEAMPDEIYTETATFEDAKSSDGGVGPGWKPGRNRKLKLRYGAVAEILKTYLPDLLGGAVDVYEAGSDFTDSKEDIAQRIKTATGKKRLAPKFTAKPVASGDAE